MTDAEKLVQEIIDELQTTQRELVWQYCHIPVWRIFARRKALRLAETIDRVATWAVRRCFNYWLEKAANGK